MLTLIETAPTGATNTDRGLTRSLDCTEEGLMPNRTTVWIPEDVARRAAEAYQPTADGCWISTYSVTPQDYAQIGWSSPAGRHGVTAHRAAWVHHTGEQIPAGQTIDHTCKNRRCVNPLHLRALSNFENARRTFGRDWPLGQCANGHPNRELFATPSRQQRCAVCHYLKQPPPQIDVTPGALIAMRRDQQDGMTLIQIADAYGTPRSHVAAALYARKVA